MVGRGGFAVQLKPLLAAPLPGDGRELKFMGCWVPRLSTPFPQLSSYFYLLVLRSYGGASERQLSRRPSKKRSEQGPGARVWPQPLSEFLGAILEPSASLGTNNQFPGPKGSASWPLTGVTCCSSPWPVASWSSLARPQLSTLLPPEASAIPRPEPTKISSTSDPTWPQPLRWGQVLPTVPLDLVAYSSSDQCTRVAQLPLPLVGAKAKEYR
ncbi:Zinc finger protein 732 [Manis javanica]|nr:Zinc finger protein 732 [Manis javanica]